MLHRWDDVLCRKDKLPRSFLMSVGSMLFFFIADAVSRTMPRMRDSITKAIESVDATPNARNKKIPVSSAALNKAKVFWDAHFDPMRNALDDILALQTDIEQIRNPMPLPAKNSFIRVFEAASKARYGM